jgi:hypothetical protein
MAILFTPSESRDASDENWEFRKPSGTKPEAAAAATRREDEIFIDRSVDAVASGDRKAFDAEWKRRVATLRERRDIGQAS